LQNVRFVDVEVNVQASPLDSGDVTRVDSFVAIGSPAYDAASARIEEEFNVNGKFGYGFETIDVQRYHLHVWKRSQFGSAFGRAGDPRGHYLPIDPFQQVNEAV
jgi:hypothetical protein